MPRHPLRIILTLLATACSLSGVAQGSTSVECGTVIVPTGLGSSTPTVLGSLSTLFTSSLYTHQVISQVLRPLVWFGADGKPDWPRGAAAAVKTPDDGLHFVVTLHDRRWSDGVPITSDDLLFTLGLLRRLGPNYVNYGTGGMPTLVASERALDAHRVELTMTRKVNPSWFVSVGLGNLFTLFPRHVFDGLSLVELRRRQNDPTLFAVGDGPFRIAEYSIGRHLILEPNPYWGGKPPQARRLVVSFPSGNTALEQLRSDQLDSASIPYLLSGFAARIPGFHAVVRPSNATYGMGVINFRSARAPFLRDLTVRRAIARSIDQKEIVALVFHGFGSTNQGPVPRVLTGSLSPAARAGYPDLSFDPVAAGVLLDGAGWHMTANGVREKDGRKLAFEIVTAQESPAGLLMAQVIQRDLARVGVAVSLHVIGFNQLLATMLGNGHEWDVATLNWTVETYPDVHDFFAADGTQNYGHYRDPAMDRLTNEEMFGSGDAALFAVQDFAAEQVPFFYLPSGTPPVLARDGLDGMAEFLTADGMWAAEEITLSGPLACPAEATRG
ncbi:MAG: peptide ABC transporter substrate-binding protein [Gluconacetobacter diazotrophicus]|nr:peptide ABC transporter substrate-binding protein [Gluconacetobacter diazotrophicus]